MQFVEDFSLDESPFERSFEFPTLFRRGVNWLVQLALKSAFFGDPPPPNWWIAFWFFFKTTKPGYNLQIRETQLRILDPC